MSWREKLRTFWIGRNGFDDLNRGLLILCAVLTVLNSFLRSRWIVLPAWVLFGWIFFRLLSRDLPARRRENAVYLRGKNGVKAFFKLQFTRIRDVRKYRYRRCPSCRAVLRLPVKRGSHDVTCPRCGHRFSVFNLF